MSVWGKSRPGTAPAGVPAGHGTHRNRPAPPGAQLSPQKRGGLATDFHSRFGSGALLEQDPGTPVAAPRLQKKSGNTDFSDPTNPRGRNQRKGMTRVEDVREDRSRAGGRTSNPAMIPCDASQRAVSADGERHVAVPYRYTTDGAWRPSKRNPDLSGTGFCHAAQSPRASHGVAEAMGAEALTDSTRKPSVLANYLNDMKKTRASLKHNSGAPSEALLRMNDGRSILPAHRQTIRESPIKPFVPEVNPDPNGPFAVENFGSYGESRASYLESRARSCEPRMDSHTSHGSHGSRHKRFEESDNCDTYGFSRKSFVNGSWTHSASANMLHHAEAPATPRRLEQKERKANARFEEMVRHMSEKNPEQRGHFENYKSRGSVGEGIFGD